jgi:crotonobetainyl-CoA:carnitine CoA-transferase CaiB-like acyl-CoA transferase
VLAALRHRDATGEGQHVEVNLMSALLAALGNDASEYTLAGIVAQRTGSDHPSVAPYGLFAAEDADLVLAVGNDRQFRELADMLGEPEIADDPRFSTNADRVANLPMLRTELENILRTHPVAEWSDKLMKAGVPAGRVNNIAQAFRLAETLGLEPTVAVPRADGSVARLVRNPIRLSRTPVTYRSAPPALAADVLSPGKQVS